MTRGTWTWIALLVATVAACGGNDKELFNDDDGGSTTSGNGGSSSSSESGTTTGNGGSGQGGAMACVDLGEPCTACELDTCADVYCECYGNTSCGLLADCVYNCPIGDTACQQGCATQFPDGITDGALLTHCAATNCPSECPGWQPLTACQLCLYQSCEPQMNLCLANAECTAMLYCLDACGDNPTCANGCYATYPGGLNEAYAVGMCSQANCLASCG